MVQIGKNIRMIRESKGMTQDELAGKLYVSRQTISNYELGRSKPDIETLTRLAEILGTDLSGLIYGVTDPAERRMEIRRFWIKAVGCGVLLFCGHFLEEWSAAWQMVHFQVWPGLVMELMCKPIFFAALGWTVLDGLGAYGKLHPIRKPWIPMARNVLLGLSIAYLVGSGIYILLGVSGITIPACCHWMMYGILRKMPLTGMRICHVLAGVFGVLFRIIWKVPEKTDN